MTSVARYPRRPNSTMAAAVLTLPIMLILTIAACSAQPPSVTVGIAKMRDADRLYQQQKYDEAAALAADVGKTFTDNAELQQDAACLLFLSGKVEESLPLFDRANELSPRLRPHNWQRGCALGCAGKFAEGAAQFKLHHDVNPNDVENSAWYYLCLAKSKSKEEADKAVIPSGGDPRPPMMEVLKMLKGSISPEELLTTIKSESYDGPAGKTAKFYGFLYVGLYYDSIGEESKAMQALDDCLAVSEPDYMGRTARHYRSLRFPPPKSEAIKGSDAATSKESSAGKEKAPK